MQRVFFAPLLFFGLIAGAPFARAAGWLSIRTGPFLVYSESNAKETRLRAAQLEQFRFSLGELLGKHDLKIEPALQVFFSREAPAQTGTTRTGGMALTQGDFPVAPATFERLARVLLDQNVGRMPDGLERGLIAFLSTTRVDGVHVTWGDPPVPAKRDADWALVHWLVTNPDTYGKFRVVLANAQSDVAPDVAYRNALGKSPADVAREVQAYLQAGRFSTIDAPSRPLSPERDLLVRQVPPDDMTLHLADLMNAESAARYRELLNSGKHKVEAEEGLASLAARGKDLAIAEDMLAKAIADGSRNAAAMVEYARIEPDSTKAEAALRKAIDADPNYADAHYLLGTKLPDVPMQIQQWRIAVQLAPRREDYWVSLAQALQSLKLWSEASKAWRGAEQAAASPAGREKMQSARVSIEGLRLDDEEAARRAAAQAKQAEIDRLKKQAIAEIRAAETQANGGNSPGSADGQDAVPWSDVNPGEGPLVRVDCIAKPPRVIVQTADGHERKLTADLKKFGLKCGAPSTGSVVSYSADGHVLAVR